MFQRILTKGAAFAALLALLSGPVAAKTGCLRWSDIDTLTRTGPDTVLAKSRVKGDFVIKFKGRCDYQRSSDNYFIVRLHSRSECVSALGAIEVHNAGACFIESVTPVT